MFCDLLFAFSQIFLATKRLNNVNNVSRLLSFIQYTSEPHSAVPGFVWYCPKIMKPFFLWIFFQFQQIILSQMINVLLIVILMLTRPHFDKISLFYLRLKLFFDWSKIFDLSNISLFPKWKNRLNDFWFKQDFAFPDTLLKSKNYCT